MRKIVVAVLLVLVTVVWVWAAWPGPATDPVQTDKGLVSGVLENGVRVFRGIPYAAPPVGPLRWTAPQPAARWSGVRCCTEFGPSCPQRASLLSARGRKSEDCLYLNVWAPSGGGPHPVMVWIHGGALNIGSGSQGYSDGTAFAQHGVVLVTINYRLGALGFLAHPALTQEAGDSGNYGLLDQIAALRWVHDNIIAFGGDPGNVTIFGESAGAVSVCCLMASPPARGLFQRTIAESGTAMGVVASRSALEREGVKLAQSLGTDGTRASLRAVPVDRLVDATSLAPFQAAAWRPQMAVGGSALPIAPNQAFASGQVTDVPLLIGTNADEGTLFGDFGVHNPVEYNQRLETLFQSDAPAAQQLFGLHGGNDIRKAVGHVVTVAMFTAPARRVARELSTHHHTVYLYRFSRVRPGVVGSLLGATHASELPYVFGTLGRFSMPRDRHLSDEMLQTWVRFAQTGNPNDGSTTGWSAYTMENDSYLEFGDTVQVCQGLFKAECDLVDDAMERGFLPSSEVGRSSEVDTSSDR